MNIRPETIEDILIGLHDGQWFGFGGKEKTYANLVIHSDDDKPTESALTTELAAQQTAFDNAATAKTTNKASGRDKLVALGLTTDELDALGIE